MLLTSYLHMIVFLFYKARLGETQKLKVNLKPYESASRKVINMQKSAIFFSPSTSEEVRSGTMDDKPLF